MAGSTVHVSLKLMHCFAAKFMSDNRITLVCNADDELTDSALKSLFWIHIRTQNVCPFLKSFYTSPILQSEDMKIGNMTSSSGILFISLGILMSMLIIGTVLATHNSASATTRTPIKPPPVNDPGNNNITRTQTIGSGTQSGGSSGSGTLQR